MKKRILGFTLIELLIVITIIGILAVVFIPTVLDAPAKARDASRQAAVNNIIKGIEAGRLAGVVTTGIAKGCVSDTTKLPATFLPYMGGGQVPVDPQAGTAGKGPNATMCDNNIGIMKYTVSSTQPILYGVFAKLEKAGTGNVSCLDATIGTAATPPSLSAGSGDCYGALSQ